MECSESIRISGTLSLGSRILRECVRGWLADWGESCWDWIGVEESVDSGRPRSGRLVVNEFGTVSDGPETDQMEARRMR